MASNSVQQPELSYAADGSINLHIHFGKSFGYIY